MKKKILTYSLFFLMTMLIAKNDIKAISVIGEGDISNYGTPCTSSTKFIACISPKYQFRVTLVNKNGTKVAGTNSVDFTISTGNPTVSTERYVNKDGVGYSLINGEKYKYKYGENDSNNFKYVSMDFKDNSSKFGDFIDNLKSRIENFEELYTIRNLSNNTITGGAQNFDFLSVFLYYSGYLGNPNDSHTIPIKIQENTSKLDEISNNDYYLLIEQTFTIYYNTAIYPRGQQNIFSYRYGTGNELMEWIDNSIKNNPGVYNERGNTLYTNYRSHNDAGYMRGLTRNFIEQAACNLKTEPENTEFEPITEVTNCNDIINTLDTPAYRSGEYAGRINILESIINKRNAGYGVYAFKIENPNSNLQIDAHIDLDICQQTNGIVELNVELPGNISNFHTEKFKTYGTDGNEAFCYDKKVTYDFTGAISKLKEEKKTSTNLRNTHGTATIVRECIINSRSVSLSSVTDFSSYTGENSIELVAYNKTMRFVPESEELVEDRSKFLIFGGGKITYTNTITYELEDVYVNSSETSGEGYIIFNGFKQNKMFGYSSNIISELNHTGTIVENSNGNIITYTLTKRDTGYLNGNPVCKFNYKSTDENTKYKFRTISLDNPFPARDGSSRLPGINWLNEKNYVFDYITNNRGVRYITESNSTGPETMYTQTTPMYTITLDHRTMTSIREYNKTHSYDDIRLECDSENKQCLSTFLMERNADNSIQMTGACVVEGSESTQKTQLRRKINLLTSDVSLSEIRNKIFGSYDKIYDFNKNNRLDSDDIDVYMNKDKNTFFYTCANKTYQSGG